MRALIVSEHAPERAWLRSALGAGWEFDEAANGNEALRRARSDRYDVVVADETTEPYGAFGLSRELKTEEDPPAVVILLERPHDGWLSQWAGADRWLVRPVDPFELSAVARGLVQEAEAARRAARVDPFAASPGEGTAPEGAAADGDDGDGDAGAEGDIAFDGDTASDEPLAP